MNILWTSKRIHHEAKLVYFQTNAFNIGIERDYRRPRENCSISDLLGYNIVVADPLRAKTYWQEVPWDMIPYMRRIHVTVGGNEGCCEADIVPPRVREYHGPERPTYVMLQPLVDKLCEILDSSDALQLFRLSIRSMEKNPGSIKNLLEPIKKLRGIAETKAVCWSMQEDMWTDWNLKGSYGRYLQKLLSLPRGAPHIEYVGDEREPNQSEDEIFDIIGGYWNGRGGFIFPSEEDQDMMNDIDDPETFFDNLPIPIFGAPPGWEGYQDGYENNLENLEDDAVSVD
jgi:hypothetical protein